MKILFFTPYFHPYISGVSVYSKLFLNELKSKHEVEILTFKYDSQLASVDDADGLKIYRMNFLFRISKGFISPQSWLFFCKKIRNKNLIIINLPSVEAIPLVLLAKLLGIKVLAIFYCNIDLGPSSIERLLSFLVNSLVKLQLLLADSYLAFSKDYIANLNWSKKLLDKATYVKPLINQAKPDAAFLNKLALKKKNQHWIGFVGRISREKGLDYLIDAIKNLSDYQQYTLVIVGPKGKEVAGENKYYLDLLNKIKKNKINCLFLGILSNEELFAFYQTIDLLALPSINSTEAYGLVQWEAMSVATPIVASDLPGVREAMQKFKMGELVPAKNAHALSEAIFRVKDLKTNRDFIKQAKKAQAFINNKQSAQVLDQIFEQL